MNSEPTPAELYAMIVARDALIVQLFLQMGAPVLAAAWDSASEEVDIAIANGAIPLDAIFRKVNEKPLPGFEDILNVEDGD